MLKEEIEIPEGVEVTVENRIVRAKAEKGEVERKFEHPHVKIKVDDGKIVLTSDIERKKVKAVMGTWKAHVKNMFLGVTKGWKAEVKLVYSHFPVKLKVEDGKLVIENFLGERKPRIVFLSDDVKVDVEKNTIFISGVEKEKVGQTAARIEEVTKVKGYDRRVFQDGCFITKKPYVLEVEDERGTSEIKGENKEKEA